MQEKEVTANGKTYTVRELKYKDMTSMADTSKDKLSELLMMKATGMTQEEFDDLPLGAGIQLQKVINELNSMEDFQKPLND